MRAFLLAAVAVGLANAWDISSIDTSKIKDALSDPSKLQDSDAMKDLLKQQVEEAAESLKGHLFEQAKSWLGQLASAESQPSSASAVDAVLSAARADLNAFTFPGGGDMQKKMQDAAAAAKSKASDIMAGKGPTDEEAKKAVQDAADVAKEKIKELFGGSNPSADDAKQAVHDAEAAAEAEAEEVMEGEGAADASDVDAQRTMQDAADAAKAKVKEMFGGVTPTDEGAKEAMAEAEAKAEAKVKEIFGGRAPSADGMPSADDAAGAATEKAADAAGAASDAASAASDAAGAAARTAGAAASDAAAGASAGASAEVPNGADAAKAMQDAAAAAKAKVDEAAAAAMQLTPDEQSALDDLKQKINSMSEDTLGKAKGLLNDLKKAQQDAEKGDEDAADAEMKKVLDEAKQGIDVVPDNAGSTLTVPPKIESKLDELSKLVDGMPPAALAEAKDMVEAMQQAVSQHSAGDETGSRLAIGKALTDAKKALDAIAAKAKSDAALPALSTNLVSLSGLMGKLTDKMNKLTDEMGDEAPSSLTDKMKQIGAMGDSLGDGTLDQAKGLLDQLKGAAASEGGEDDTLSSALDKAMKALDSITGSLGSDGDDTPAADAAGGSFVALSPAAASAVRTVINMKSSSSRQAKSLADELGELTADDLAKAKDWLGELKAAADAKQQASNANSPELRAQAEEVAKAASDKAQQDAEAELESVEEAKAAGSSSAARDASALLDAAALVAAFDFGPFQAKANKLASKLHEMAPDAQEQAQGFLGDLKAAAEAKAAKASATTPEAKEAAKDALHQAMKAFGEKKEAALEAAKGAVGDAMGGGGAAAALVRFDLSDLTEKAKELSSKLSALSPDAQAKAHGWLDDLKEAADAKAKQMAAKGSQAREKAEQMAEAAKERAEQKAEAALEAAGSKAKRSAQAAEQAEAAVVEAAEEGAAGAAPAAASAPPSVDDAVVLIDDLSREVQSLRAQLKAMQASGVQPALVSFALWSADDKAALKKWLTEQSIGDPADLLERAKAFKAQVIEQKKRDIDAAKDELQRRIADAKEGAAAMLAKGKNASEVYGALKANIKDAKKWAKHAFSSVGDSIFNLTNATDAPADDADVDADAAREANATLVLLQARAAAQSHASHFSAASVLLVAGVALPAAGIALARRRRARAETYDSYVAASERALARGIGASVRGDESLTVSIMRDDRL